MISSEGSEELTRRAYRFINNNHNNTKPTAACIAPFMTRGSTGILNPTSEQRGLGVSSGTSRGGAGAGRIEKVVLVMKVK